MSRSIRPLRYALLLALALLGLAAGVPAVSAAETVNLTVDSLADSEGGSCAPEASCTLREAVNLVAEGEEEGGSIGGDVVIDFAVTGTIEIEDEFEIWLGVGVESLTIEGPGPGDLKIDGKGETRVFSFYEGTGSLKIARLTVENGHVGGFAVDGDGGAALFQANGEVTLEDVRLTENHIVSDRDGGAIDVEAGNLEIINSEIDANTTDADFEGGAGGGINVDSSGSTVTLRGSDLVGNEADGSGGGIYLDEGNLVVSEDSLILDNKSAESGGGISLTPDGAHEATIADSAITGNSATQFGGGILAETGAGGLRVEATTINANKASEGGGIRVEGPTAIETSTLSENEAWGSGSSGGGILVISDSLLLDSSTVAKNSGGGIFASDGETLVHASTIAANSNTNGDAGGIFANEGVTVKVRSSIVAENTGEGGGPADCAAEVVSEGHNILGTEDSGCVWPTGEGDQLGAAPLLGALADNGGPTETMGPASAASPAINRGGNPEEFDQRAAPRPVPQGEPAKTDVGAVEVQAPFNLLPPAISADPELVEGALLTCDPGTWDNDTVTNSLYSYLWLADEVPIGNEATHELTEGDAGREIVCRVSVDNGATSTVAESEPVELAPGAIAIEPTLLDFGDRLVGSGPSGPETFTVKNTGGAAVGVVNATSSEASQFPTDAGDCIGETLSPGDECTIEARFSPTAAGVQESTLSVLSDVPTATATMGGTGTVMAVSISPTSFDFGARRIDAGPSDAKAFEVSSAGTAPVTIGTASIATSTEFAILADGDDCVGETLEPGETCTVEVVFDPAATGAKTAVLSVPSDAPTATANLGGTGTEPGLSISPTSFDFGDQPVASGPSGAKTFELTSTGSAAVTVDAATLGASTEFTIPTNGDQCAGETLAPGEMCTVEVVFDPTSPGAQAATLSVPSEVPAVSALLSGTGTVPAFAAEPAALDFGSRQVGEQASETVTISNSGDAPAEIDSVALAGANPGSFSLPAASDGCSGTELLPEASCTIAVGFAPSQAGEATATLEVAGDAPTLAVPLSGTGTAKPEPPAPPAPTPPSGALLGTGPFAGNAAGNIPLDVACISPSGAACPVTLTLSVGSAEIGSWNATLPAGSSDTAEVGISTTARKQLASKGRLAAEAVINVTGGTRATVSLTLVAPKAPKLVLRSARRAGDAIVAKLACQGSGTRCRGKLTLSAAKGGTKVAGGDVAVAKGSREVRLALTGAGKRLLEDEPQAQLKATATTRDGVYQRTTVTTKHLRLGA